MDSRITQALNKLFEKHRIVFWYDVKKELRKEYDVLDLPGIEKIELTNNEFGVKYRILREQANDKFLIYHEGPQPAHIDNWLLDVQLAHVEFRTDQVSIWLAELELGLEFTDVVQSHTVFYGAAKRRDALKRLLTADDTVGMIRLKMLAVCTGADSRIDNVMEALLAELAEQKEDKINLISRCNLDDFLWEQVKRCYGYSSDTPGVQDFVIELFKSCYAMGTDGDIKLTGDALVFLKRWKDSRRHGVSFEFLSNQCAELLNMEQDIGQRDFQKLVELDYFRLIDQKIISELVRNVADRTISAGDCALVVRQRRQSHWYDNFEHIYNAVDVAAQFVQHLEEAKLTMESMADGIQRYSRSWFRLDQMYRKFIYHLRRSGQASLLETLTDRIENLYTNNFLLKVNDNWQQVVDAADRWNVPAVPRQKDFFKKSVLPFLKQNKKVFVIISDALRYEIGEEFLSLIRREDRYEARLEPCLSMMPSYTQMGMAALLPNAEIKIADNDTGTVIVDGQSSQGLSNRIKILNNGGKWKASAVTADNFMAMPREGDEGYRALFREHDVVYIYHNRIDATGDKRDSEERTFEAAHESLDELVKIVRKLSTANVTNMIVTADHGFIYQHRVIDESDFAGNVAEGDEILFRNRRFILGKGLKANSSMKRYTSAELGLSGEMEVLIPKSINRLRLKGSGSRFVHGGAALQETVIPVVHINKRRKSDIALVGVDIIRGATSIITSGQLGVALYQKEAVSDKVQPRNLRAGIYTEAGELISDCHELTFDLTSENPREREQQVRFVLTRKADDANGQEVILRLDKKISGTSHFKEYKSARYLMRRSFTSDFDF